MAAGMGSGGMQWPFGPEFGQVAPGAHPTKTPDVVQPSTTSDEDLMRILASGGAPRSAAQEVGAIVPHDVVMGSGHDVVFAGPESLPGGTGLAALLERLYNLQSGDLDFDSGPMFQEGGGGGGDQGPRFLPKGTGKKAREEDVDGRKEVIEGTEQRVVDLDNWRNSKYGTGFIIGLFNVGDEYDFVDTVRTSISYQWCDAGGNPIGKEGTVPSAPKLPADDKGKKIGEASVDGTNLDGMTSREDPTYRHTSKAVYDPTREPGSQIGRCDGEPPKDTPPGNRGICKEDAPTVSGQEIQQVFNKAREAGIPAGAKSCHLLFKWEITAYAIRTSNGVRTVESIYTFVTTVSVVYVLGDKGWTFGPPDTDGTGNKLKGEDATKSEKALSKLLEANGCKEWLK